MEHDSRPVSMDDPAVLTPRVDPLQPAPVSFVWIRTQLRKLEVDRAILYVLLGRVWQVFAGPVTALLIASYFSGDVQGYFYTFGSLLAMQSFVELGLHGLLINFASHEWTRLSLDEHGRPQGDEQAVSRLASLVQQSLRWYSAVSVLFMMGAGSFGVWFFAQSSSVQVAWLWPWIVSVALSALSLLLLPAVAILEGCNQVAPVNRVRTLQAITGNVCVWAAIPLGAQLWTVPIIGAVRLVWELTLVLGKYGHFYVHLVRQKVARRIDWIHEVWPLQWRTSAQSALSYFGYGLFTPLMFHYHDKLTGGQMGMTWTILLSMQGAALAWVQTRIPRFGMLASQQNYAENDRLFRKLMLLSFAAVVAAGSLFCGIVWGLNWFNSIGPSSALMLAPVEEIARKIAGRLLPPLPTLLFTLGIVLAHIPICQMTYVRAHKRDPFLWLTTSTNLGIGILAWQLGKAWGPAGAAWGYVSVVALLMFPGTQLITQRIRRTLR